ncbi:MAG: translation initiation factor 2 [Desulfovibrio sp.]|nr:translation initiation factor 2 [Desulfovibrio sp.]
MKKVLVILAAFSLLSGGCAWMGFGSDDSVTTQSEEAQAAEPEIQADEPEPAKTTAKKTAKTTVKTKKGAKSEAQIKEELDAKARQLVAQSARTLLPNKTHKEVKKVGSQWVATYMDVDTQNISTEMHPGKAGQYVGTIRYRENIMQCKGATKAAALSAPCEKAGARRLTELISYHGGQWQD